MDTPVNTEQIIDAVNTAMDLGPLRALVNSAGVGWAQPTRVRVRASALAWISRQRAVKSNGRGGIDSGAARCRRPPSGRTVWAQGPGEKDTHRNDLPGVGYNAGGAKV